MSRSTLWRILAIGLPLLGALVAPLPAVDLAYQLRAGAEILDHGAIPSVDAWTFTIAGQPWLDQQWGAQVLLTLIFRLGGWTGLVLLRATLVALAFGLLLLVVRRRAPSLGSPAATLLVIAAFLVSITALALRPQLLAIDLFAATLLALAYRHDHPRAVWLIPLLALLWANLHGTFLLAPALCGLAWIEDLATMPPSRRGARHRMLLVGLVTAAATVVTPFGPAVWGYVANLASNPTIAGRVSEWQPPSPLTVSGAIVWLSLLGVAGLVADRIRRTVRETGHVMGAIPWPEVLALLLFGGFAVVSGRGTAWWPFVAVTVVAPWLARRRSADATAPASADRPTPPLLRRLNLGIAAIIAVACVATLPVWRPVGVSHVPHGAVSYAPQVLGAVLAGYPQHLVGSPPARVWNPQAWGSWLEFIAPEYAYALDSRIELFPARVWDDADAVARGDLGILSAYHVDVVVTDRAADQALDAALLADGTTWVRAVETCDGSVWFLRSDFPKLEPSPSSGCPWKEPGQE